MPIRSGSLRRRSAREASHCEIEAAPEKMNRAAFADELRPEFREDALDVQQNSPELLCLLWIIRAMDSILIEGDRVGHFDWHSPNLYVDAIRCQHFHNFLVEIRYRHCSERNRFA